MIIFKNKWKQCLTLFLALSIATTMTASIALADTQLGQTYDNAGEGIILSDKLGGKQTYYKKNNTILFLGADQMIYATKNNQTESIFPSLNGFFVSGNRIIAYDGSNGDSKGVWNNYDISTGKTSKLSSKYFGNFASIFWADSQGVYYTKNGKNSTYYYNFTTNQESSFGNPPGQPCGIIDGQIISISFGNRRIYATKHGKHTVLYKGTKDFRGATVINDMIYISTANGMYRMKINEKTPVCIFYRYTAIAPMAGDTFIAIVNDDNNEPGLTGDVQLYIGDKQKYASITSVNGSNVGGGALLNPYFNEEVTAILMKNGAEFSIELPPYSNWTQWPNK